MKLKKTSKSKRRSRSKPLKRRSRSKPRKRRSRSKPKKSKRYRKIIDGKSSDDFTKPYINIEHLPYKKRIKYDSEYLSDYNVKLILYRCLRTDELPYILDHGLLPPCTPCPEEGKCCDISSGAHITAGTKAKIKSRYISASENEAVAHWCANVTGNPTSQKSATYVKFMAKYDRINVINPQTDIEGIGITGRNAAKASAEILIKDNVPSSNILEIYRVKNISKGEYTSLPDNFIADGMEFKKIIGKGKEKKITHHLSMKIWSSVEKIDFDIVSDKWPKSGF